MLRLMAGTVALAILLMLSPRPAAQTQPPGPLVERQREDLRKPQYSKPPEAAPQEFREMMLANNDILGIDTPPDNPTGGAVFTGAFTGPLAEHLNQENYTAIAKDGETLKANFAKIEAFFAARQSGDAVELAKAGQKALDDMKVAAMAKNRVAALTEALKVATTCRNCHLSHRVYVITEPIGFGIVR